MDILYNIKAVYFFCFLNIIHIHADMFLIIKMYIEAKPRCYLMYLEEIYTMLELNILGFAAILMFGFTSERQHRNVPKFSDRYAWANIVDPDQTAPLTL